MRMIMGVDDISTSS